jgi:hypothetical protein
VTFGKAILADYTTIFTFGTHLYKVRELVQQDMETYVSQITAPPADTCIAYALVQKLATRCTLANMQALLDAQVAIPSDTRNKPLATRSSLSARLSAPRTSFAAPATTTVVPSISTTVVPRQR